MSQEPSSKVEATFYKPFMKYLSGDNPNNNLHLRASSLMRDEAGLQSDKIRSKLSELYEESKKLFRCLYYPILMKYYSL